MNGWPKKELLHYAAQWVKINQKSLMIYFEKGETLILQVIEKWTLHYHQIQEKGCILNKYDFSKRIFKHCVLLG